MADSFPKSVADDQAEAGAVETPMTPQQLAEAKQYGRIELTCDLVGRAIDLVFLVVLAFALGGPAGWLISWLPNGGWPESARLAVLMLIITVMNMAVSFPLAFYSGFIVEHQYALSRQSLGRWLWRYAKRHALEIVFGLLLIMGVYWVIWLTGPWWWLCAAVAFFVISIVLGQLAPVLIFPLFNKIEPLEPGQRTDELNGRMSRLADGTGLTIEGVFRMDMSADTVKANAMLAGLGKTRRVIMGDNLLEQFTPDEIEVIFAHEIGHHVHRHIRKMIV
ncbi:MAG: M48 family metalloprotease, partial [Planctomycetota bacterium]|nr:M48 family metalloprotease [Planctomycetota bacterium]